MVDTLFGRWGGSEPESGMREDVFETAVELFVVRVGIDFCDGKETVEDKADQVHLAV